MTEAELLAVMPAAKGKATIYVPFLTSAAAEFGIDSPRRLAAFLAQLAHESGQLRYTKELGSNAGYQYEGRKDLGNTQPGDGIRFCGRGLIQLTGRNNYRACGGELGVNLEQYPELLEQPGYASRSAGWFWRSKKLNRFADFDQFGALTRSINGGFNGLDDRISFWLRAREILGVKPL